MTKVPCYNLFITYSNTFFSIILIKNTKKSIEFHSETEELSHKIGVSFVSDVTNSVTRLRRMQVITSPRSKYMISGYQPGRADNQRVGNSVSYIRTLGYRAKYSSQYVKKSYIVEVYRDLKPRGY